MCSCFELRCIKLAIIVIKWEWSKWLYVQTEFCHHYTDRSSFSVALPHSFPLRIKLSNNFFCTTEGRRKTRRERRKRRRERRKTRRKRRRWGREWQHEIVCTYITYTLHTQWHQLTSTDTNWHQLTSTDINWHQLTPTDINWHQLTSLTSTDINWHQLTSTDINWHHIVLCLTNK